MIKFRELPFKIEQTWLTSDWHLYHKNIAKGSSNWSGGYRDFPDQFLMTDHIVDTINSYVKPTDLLINVGDLSFGGKENIKKSLDRVNCQNIIHIEGNHDHHTLEFEMLAISGKLLDFKQIGYFNISGQKLVCCHFPFAIWHQSHKNIPLAFGHVHGSYPGLGKSMDVGIDNIYKLFGEYRPISLLEFMEIIDTKETYLESHHNIKTN